MSNKYLKIDLVTDEITKIDLLKNDRNNWYNSSKVGYVSCFESNINYDYYCLGTYSQQIFLIDRKTDKSICSLPVVHTNGVNKLLCLKTHPNMFLSGARKDNYIYLWDTRNLSNPVNNYTRSNDIYQKLNFCLDISEEILFCGNKVN